ncbi:MAG: histone H1 [Cytophagales bacterium]|nr:histone H1 [Cytophagales bacterium]
MSSKQNRYEEELCVLVESLRDDASKFYVKGNSSAGTRLRKGLMALIRLCGEIRKDVQALKNEKEAKSDKKA